MSETADIHFKRLPDEKLTQNFCDIEPALTDNESIIESDRCYYCYDAPCIEACPTSINIPSFIRKISTQNILGAAKDILSENIFGGTCARACPVETLCEHACVRNTENKQPVKIGLLQRYATDHVFDKAIPLFQRAPSSGKKIAIIGAGPAGLSCAHKLSCLGHEVRVFDKKNKAGGLNEFGLARYKMVDDFAQREIDYLMSIGGITLEHNKQLGKTVFLDQLQEEYDAVFIAVGLSGSNQLGLANEHCEGVFDAIDFIERIRQTPNLSDIAIGKNIVVIGGGNTAIDMATQAKRLGAETVSLVYRQGEAQMKATAKEQNLAKLDGVNIHYFAKPSAISAPYHILDAVRFERTVLDDKLKLQASGRFFTLKADMLFKAIGQHFNHETVGEHGLAIVNGRIKVDTRFKTNLGNVFAGGDCIHNGEDLTVRAVEDGKRAAFSIDQFVKGK